MRPHYSHSSRENATPSSGTSPLASCKEVPPPPGRGTSGENGACFVQLQKKFLICIPQWSLEQVHFVPKPVGFQLACSRLSDRVEDAKVTGMRKVAGRLLSPVSSRFMFELSQFSGPDYLGAWNRLGLSKIRSNFFSG